MIDSSKASITYRNIKTFNGIPFDIAKSALQKYIRRAYPEKAQFISSEIFLLHWKNGGKGSLTNFYNRICTIYFEDIGLASPYLIYMVDETLKDLRSHNFDTLSEKLPYLMQSMACSPHSRYYSHVKSHYSRPGINLQHSTSKYKYNLGRDEKLRSIVDSLIHCLEEKSDAAIYWILKLMDPNLKLLEKRYNSTRWGMLVFDIVNKGKFVQDKRSFEICL